MLTQLKKLSQSKPNLVFDFDKTIAQMEIDWSDWHVGVSEIYAKFDTSHGYGEGKDPHGYYNQMAERFGEELIREVKRFVADYEQKKTTGFTPYVELVEFIESYKLGQMYVYSSNARRTVEKGLESLGLLGVFGGIVTRDEVNKIKPDPEGFYLIEGFEDNREDFVMIGDSSGDEMAAETAGVEFVKCTYFGTYEFTGGE